jgi:hypothetical protein
VDKKARDGDDRKLGVEALRGLSAEAHAQRGGAGSFERAQTPRPGPEQPDSEEEWHIYGFPELDMLLFSTESKLYIHNEEQLDLYVKSGLQQLSICLDAAHCLNLHMMTTNTFKARDEQT